MENIVKEVRSKVLEMFSGYKTIDTLLKDKVDDYIIIEEQPLPIKVGKKVIYVGNLTLENEQRFFSEWGKIVSLLSARIINMELSDKRRKELHAIVAGKHK